MPAVGEGYAERLNRVATDPSLPPASRIRELRSIRNRIAGELDREPGRRDELVALLGHADRYLGDNELRREASALDHALDRIELREDADVRDDLLDEGYGPEAMDSAGYFSHEQLDAMEQEGTLPEEIA